MISESEDTHKRWLERPRLRAIEVIPVGRGGQEAVCLRDPSRIAPKPLFLSPAAMVLLPLMSGENDLRDMQAAILRSYGQLVELEQIENLVRALDEGLFIEGETYDRYLARAIDEFSASTVRRACLAGQAYSADAEALTEELNGYYRHPRGPGRSEPDEPGIMPRGLAAPHIDYIRGGWCYAWAYQRLDPELTPDLVVVLGTAHSWTQNLLAMCAKDFETPLGLLHCQRDLCQRLSSRLGGGLSQDEFVHRGEHSIELQAVWLMSRFRRPEKIGILPILCGSFHELMERGATPEDAPEYEETVLAIKEELDDWASNGSRILFLASVDLSHVGPQFGDRFPVTKEVESNVRDYDAALIEAAADGDYRSFYHQVARNLDGTHVCGLPGIYTMLRLIGGAKGDLLSYDQWVDENGQGMVSFASLVFS